MADDEPDEVERRRLGKIIEIDPNDPKYRSKRTKKPEEKATNGHGAHEALELPELYAYEPRPFEQIPRRQWLHAWHYIRKFIVMTIAPGGWGKTALVLVNAIEMALGRGLLGPAPPQRLRVLYWNGEDPPEEIERRIAAVCIHHKIDPKELKGWFFLGNKVKGKQRLAQLNKNQEVVINKPVFAHIEAFIKRHRIDCVIIDPLLPFHRIPESRNEFMEEMIALTFADLVERYNCCIELAHHTRKTQNAAMGEISVDDSRGGGAVTNVARSVRILNRITKAEAKAPEISASERRYYLRVSRDKPNMARADQANWIHLASQELPNGPAGQGDNVQVAERWEYPSAFEGVSSNDALCIRAEVRKNPNYRTSSQSPDWIGVKVAELLGLRLDADGVEERLKFIIKTWLENGVLAKQKRLDATRKPREFVTLGNWEEPAAPLDDFGEL